jgi:hypothetical protein
MRISSPSLSTLLFPALLFAALLSPVTAFALSAQDKTDIAARLNKAYPAISVSVVDTPVISGDNDPSMFRISPLGKKNYGNLFLLQRYDIIAKPNTPGMLGSYACDLAGEFVRARRKVQANFLPSFQFKAGAPAGGVSFEISADQETFAGIIYGILTLLDAVSNDYDKFNILIRGYADRGDKFQSQLRAPYLYKDVSFFPLKSNPDPFLSVYLRTLQTRQVGPTYSNEDLPNLRATFMKREVIDRFLDECHLTRPGANLPASIVLDGGVIDVKDADYRTIDIFFYAYR